MTSATSVEMPDFVSKILFQNTSLKKIKTKTENVIKWGSWIIFTPSPEAISLAYSFFSISRAKRDDWTSAAFIQELQQGEGCYSISWVTEAS